MKSIKLVPLVLFAAACGQNDRVFQTRTVVEVAKPCTVDQLQDGASISCPDGTSAVVSNGQQGAPGPAGLPGTAGLDGRDCKVEDTENGAIITCATGSVVINDGQDGVDGKAKKINPEPIYEGHFCSRTVVRIGKERYVINHGLVPLNKDWYSIGSCRLRYQNKQIQVD